MKKYAIISSDGLLVVATAMSITVPDGAIELPNDIDLDLVLRSYILDGELVPRPAVPIPIQTEIGVYISGCPTDSIITVHDVISHEILAQITTTLAEPSADFELPDTGRYQFEIEPPVPYIGIIFNCEVI